MNKNTCGECKACCIVLPISEPELVKAAGEPCKHLCASGCSIYESSEWPELCRDYYCGWRHDKWFDQRPMYRPDKLGVMFHFGYDALALYELRPGSLNSQTVRYIKNHLQGDFLIKHYPFGVLDGVKFDAGIAVNGLAKLDTEMFYWEDLGGQELLLRKNDTRTSLPLVT